MQNKIIDFHQHCILPIDQIKEIMDRNTIEKSVQIPFTMGNYTWKEMSVIAGMCPKPDKYAHSVLDKLIKVNSDCFAMMHGDPRFEFAPWISIMQLPKKLMKYQWFIDAKILKFIPVFDDYVKNYWIELGEFIEQIPRKIIMIHTGWGSSPAYYNNLIGNHPETTFVLAHMKEDDDSDNIERIAILRDYDNAYVETSYLSSPKRLSQYVKMGFENKILYGSDFRIMDDEQSLKWFIDAVKISDISDIAKEKILYKNAETLLKKV